MKNFIDINQTEDEQAQQVKDWIRNNIVIIIFGIVLGFGGMFGWDYYNNYQQNKNLEARVNYLSVVAGEDKILEHQSYNNQALLVQAKNNLTDSVKSQELLNQISTQKIIDDVKDIKLAQIYFADKKYDKALALLENNPLKTTSMHLVGDIYFAQGKTELAKEFYENSLQNAKNEQVKQILQIKINNLK
jgi:predicted negative regulator of RcsB-dependent stress response